MTLTEKRRSLDMALGELARKVGLSSSEMSKIERGRRSPTEEECSKIGASLGWTSAQVKESLPSKEEVERDGQRMLDSLAAMSAVMEDAKRRGFGKGNGGTAEIECPICKNRLRYSIASVNGHCWGACSNKDCVRWMQ